MLDLAPLAFASPWVLAGLSVLPVLWWLLRVTPPAPRVMQFPGIELLRGLMVREQSPARTPWWLLVLRLLIVALVTFGLARPLLNPEAAMPGNGPVVLVVDNGWASAQDWPARQEVIEDVIARAERVSRPVLLLPTAAVARTGAPVPAPAVVAAAEARKQSQGLMPMPWETDRAAAAALLDQAAITGAAHAVWLSDGLAGPGAIELARRLQSLGSLELRLADLAARPHLVLPPIQQGPQLTSAVVRSATGFEEVRFLRLIAGDGRILAREPVTFGAEAARAEAQFVIPVELRNQVARLQLEGDPTVGATVLLDNRWRRRPVGLVAETAGSGAQPLLSDVYYLERALGPFTEIRRGTVEDLMTRALAVMVLPDPAVLGDRDQEAVGRWIDHGGMVIRFAGPRMAKAPDPLIPVRLRLGDRTLGGALSWSEPARLAPFDRESPFAGLTVSGDVTVSRQVLAEPAIDLQERTWARLQDGTPLVTAERRGKGWLVLVHTTAGPEWSDLSLSGLFVEMLQRLVNLSEGIAGGGGAAMLAPVQVLDGYARLVDPSVTVHAIPGEAFARQAVTPAHPPGYYGSDQDRHALNLSGQLSRLTPLSAPPPGVVVRPYAGDREFDLKPWLLAGAFGLLMFDLLLSLGLRGLLGRAARAGIAAVALLGLATAVGGLGGAGPAAAADDARAQKATADIYLAYVLTGDPAIDRTSRAGLAGLAAVLNQRTAVDAAGALGVNPERDELAFFPFLYWPVPADQAPLPPHVRDRVNAYLRNGGTVLFDTRDQQAGAGFGGNPGSSEALRRIAQGLEVPELAPVAPDHVLTKSFYLMQDFPGRFRGGALWVEATESARHDGVSSVIIGSNDYAGAWAVDDAGRPLYATAPGGERQRELAYRFGVNLVMYALTGNYKADQVHVPAILERLGQ